MAANLPLWRGCRHDRVRGLRRCRQARHAGGIAARAAEIADATVIASIGVTDQSMGRRRAFRDHEYSRRSWVRFAPEQAPERLNSKVIDTLRQLNLGGEAVAGGARTDTPNSN